MSIWVKILIVAAGGALGTVGRFLLEQITRQPYGVWFINTLASLLMGLLFGIFIMAPWSQTHKETFQLFLMVGVMGGFSTFAHYMLYCVNYFREGQEIFSIVYMVSTILVSLVCMLLGLAIGMKIKF